MEFFSPEYNQAITHAVINGLQMMTTTERTKKLSSSQQQKNTASILHNRF